MDLMTPKMVRADELGRDRIRAEGRSAEKPGGVPSRITPAGRPEGVRGFLPECYRIRLECLSQKATGLVRPSGAGAVRLPASLPRMRSRNPASGLLRGPAHPVGAGRSRLNQLAARRDS